MPGRPRLQRMLLHMHVRGESVEERDKLLAGAAMLAKKASRGRQVQVQEDGTGLEQLKGIKLHETIHVIAHSDGVKVWDLEPGAFAAKLFAALPDGYHGRVKLIACHSGEERAAKETYRNALAETTTYAQELAHELALLQNEAGERAVAVPTVLGRPGVGTVDPATGRPRVYPPKSGAAAAVKAAHAVWIEDELRDDTVRLAELMSEKEMLSHQITALVESGMDASIVSERARLNAADDAALAEVKRLKQAHDDAESKAKNMSLNMPGSAPAARAVRAAQAAKKRLDEAQLAQQHDQAAFKLADDVYQPAYESAAGNLKSDASMVSVKKRMRETEWAQRMLAEKIRRRREELDHGTTGRNKVSELQLTVGQALQGKAASAVYAVAPGAPRVRHVEKSTATGQLLEAPALLTVAPLFAEDFMPRAQPVPKVVAEGMPIVPSTLPPAPIVAKVVAVHVVQESFTAPPGGH